MTRGSEIRLHSADLLLRRRSTNSRPRDCVTIGSTSQPFARPPAPRCYQGEIITRWDLDRLLKCPAVGPGTTQIGPPALHPSPRFFNSTAITPLPSASGI